MNQSKSETIEQNIAQLAADMGFEADWGREDGYTWLTIEDESVTPDKYKELSQAIADASGVEFFFAQIRCGSMSGAVNWDMDNETAYTDESNCDIEDYGTRFSPVALQPKPSSPSMR